MRLRLIALVSVVALAIPTLALAAYNDVTLTTDTVIQVGGYTLDVSGSSAAVQSITVNSGNFSVTLGSGSAITVTSPTLQQLSSDVQSDMVSNPCTGSESSISLAYSGGSTVTNVITPSATVCSGSGSTPSLAPASTGSGSGPAGIFAPAPPTIATTTTPSNTSGLTQAQIQSVLSLLASFGVGQSTIDTVSAILNGGTAASNAASTSFISTRDLQLGDTGADVKALQQYLNAHGFTLADYGPGSPGNETEIFGYVTQYQLAQLQKANGISPAVGYFGLKTRAYIGQH